MFIDYAMALCDALIHRYAEQYPNLKTLKNIPQKPHQPQTEKLKMAERRN